jgi:hypothetical protein
MMLPDGYTISQVTTPYGTGWVVCRGERAASALIFKTLRGAVRLAEWDAKARRQWARR